MRTMDGETAARSRQTGNLRGWFALAGGLMILWVTTYVVLPWGSRLPYIQPIMHAIAESDIDAGAYWYTQSEETALAQVFVGNAIGKHH